MIDGLDIPPFLQAKDHAEERTKARREWRHEAAASDGGRKAKTDWTLPVGGLTPEAKALLAAQGRDKVAAQKARLAALAEGRRVDKERRK